MGACSSREGSSDSCEDDVRGLKEKIRLLREEVRGVMCEMDKESKAHEKDMVVFAFKEAGWRTEKKKLKEEMKTLRKMVGERMTMRELQEGETMVGSADAVFEQMQQERARRDEAIHKWKQLYHAIKMELDDLIQRTHHGEGLYWGGDERAEALKTELQAKEETIKALKEQVVSMEQEQYKRDREIDILRQSLRIMTSKKEEAEQQIRKHL